jgi:hypothetical protein
VAGELGLLEVLATVLALEPHHRWCSWKLLAAGGRPSQTKPCSGAYAS